MRKIFSSLRLENVEAVARLLEAEGIQVRIENGRALHRAIRGNFSYRDDTRDTTPQPEVWVVRSDDQPRARALMREAGLLQDTTRPDALRFAPVLPATSSVQGNKRLSHLRYGLLALVLVVVTAHFIQRPDAVNTPRTPPPRPELTMLDEVRNGDEPMYVIATPPQLAVVLARRALSAHRTNLLCLAIDGSDPPETALLSLIGDTNTATAASACPSESALHIDVHHYTTDGSGAGTVLVTQRSNAHESTTQQLSVRRTGESWSVLTPKY